MITGRKPKPLEQRKREGNLGKRALPAPIRVAPLTEAPEPPDRLSEDAGEVWALVAESLVNVGMLQRQHLPILEAFAELVGLAREARRQLAESGGQVISTKQGVYVNPWLTAYQRNVKLALSLGEHLGASPVALARLGMATIKGLTLQQELAERHGDRRNQ